MKLKLTTLLLFQILIAFPQKSDFSKSIYVIPDSLANHANVVARKLKTAVTIASEKSMTISYYKLITVLNENGNDAFFVQDYDKYSKVNNIQITIYNGSGKIIKKVKSKEINDVTAASDNYYLFSDNRYKYYKHIPLKYPYTIEVSCTVKTSNTAFIPRWYASNNYNMSVQDNAYSITYPENLTLNSKEYSFDNYPIKKVKNKNTISYKITNFKALDYEPYSPPFSKIVPNARFSLNQFSLAGEVGDASSWEKLGKWMNEKLLKGRDEIPEETKNDIKQLVQGIDDPIERAKLVYEYMQNRTRYISIQIGIGGWKPMLAKDVDRLRYGDCKALSYYTKALLEEADVKSNYTIVYSDSHYNKSITKDLVSIQGNHAILMVPTKKDTIWLECTSQKLPFGQTGATDDRDVLIIANNSGKIVHTNKYDSSTNLQQTTATIVVNEEQQTKATVAIVSSGKQYNNHYSVFFKANKEQLKYYKEKFANLLDVSIDSIALENDKKNIVFTEHLKLTIPNYVEKIGNDIIITPNIANIYSYLPKRIKNRKFPLYIKDGFLDEDEITIKIPTNYKINNLPSTFSIENEFGRYKVTFSKKTAKEILYKRSLLMYASAYDKAKYETYRNFIKAIIKTDKQKIIISKK